MIKCTFIMMAILNFITFLKILHSYKKSRKTETVVGARKRMCKNILCFLQTILQDSLYFIDMTFTFKLSSWSTNRIWTYFSGTFVWECLHSFDGFIMIIFNERLSFLKTKVKHINILPIVGGHLRQRLVSLTTLSHLK
ncbi:7TM GPCR serpentine receptor class x (Srx) domain-containing protein [Caenorhabditis elegans]|nr:7TM GPCR serpentine receptor class x (Srx) domain-containing protein [Caenorhabditis elegans]CCD62813.1 7TM GPCR serpentine receptor class x (Srx) domain-containing protein [Caenorhabditis elegans]|eukprot:NP_001023782.1 Serpentine Receptor, class X [Caenorhabditis elegans]